MDCVFCKIANNEISSDKVYEDGEIMVFLDISPVNPGHLLAVPKKHYEDGLQTEDDLLAKMIKIGKKAGQALLETGLAEGVNFAMNNGQVAGQVVFHTHLHIIPRLASDGLKMWGSGEYKSDEQKKEIAGKIKKLLNQ